MEFTLRECDEVSSTNDVVRGLIAAGKGEGQVVCARCQTGGYGRRGHEWLSPPGGLYLSALLEPAHSGIEVATLGMVAALAVCRTLESVVPAMDASRPLVKWPNDVVVSFGEEGPGGGFLPSADASVEACVEAGLAVADGHGLAACHNGGECVSRFAENGGFCKISGISIEKIGSKACLGIGVNVLCPGGAASGDLVLQGKNRVVYLEELTATGACPSVAAVRDALLLELGQLYDAWQREGFSPFSSQVNERFALAGREIVVSNGSSDDSFGSSAVLEKRGVALGVAADGALLLHDLDAGDLEHIYDGTVSLA